VAGHIVVDKTHFQDMMAREVRKQVDAAIRQLQARLSLLTSDPAPAALTHTHVAQAKRDEPVFRAHDAFARDRQMIAALLRDKIGGQREQLRALVAGHTQRGKEKHELLSALTAFMDEDQKLWEGILAHPFFHVPQHDDPDASEPQQHPADPAA
jgi:hypothetical protein